MEKNLELIKMYQDSQAIQSLEQYVFTYSTICIKAQSNEE